MANKIYMSNIVHTVHTVYTVYTVHTVHKAHTTHMIYMIQTSVQVIRRTMSRLPFKKRPRSCGVESISAKYRRCYPKTSKIVR